MPASPPSPPSPPVPILPSSGDLGDDLTGGDGDGGLGGGGVAGIVVGMLVVLGGAVGVFVWRRRRAAPPANVAVTKSDIQVHVHSHSSTSELWAGVSESMVEIDLNSERKSAPEPPKDTLSSPKDDEMDDDELEQYLMQLEERASGAGAAELELTHDRERDEFDRLAGWARRSIGDEQRVVGVR